MGRKSLTVDAPHDLLDGLVHQDTAVDAVTRGSIIIGNSAPAWDELVIGVANSVLVSDGTDPSWSATPTLTSLTTTGNIELGNATDTTLSRSAAGVLAVEGTDLLQADGSIALAGAWDMGSQVLTNVNIDSGVITGITDLTVADGGTGVSSLTDGGILLGSGTSAVTALGQATNGQLPIGSTGADPVLATLTGTTNEIEITNGAGTITIGMPNDVTVAGDLVASGTGPHAFGGVADGQVQFRIAGTFTPPAGANNRLLAIDDPTLNALANADASLIWARGTIAEASSGTHANFTTAIFLPPTITAGAATLTNASTVKILAAPTGATNNYALWVDAGTTRLDGDLDHDGSNIGFYGVTPAARPGITDDIKDALTTLGLLQGTSATPLDLDGGALTATGNSTVGGNVTIGAELTVSGNFNHDGSNIGFFGTAPAVQAAAYTQTFSTADRTHAARTSGGLTDNSGGTVSQTLADITEANNLGSADRVPTEDAIASLANELADVRADLADTAQVLNAVVDDLQAYGLVQ